MPIGYPVYCELHQSDYDLPVLSKLQLYDERCTMKILILAAAIPAVMLLSSATSAQVGARRFSRPRVKTYDRPVVSPYMNLLNRGNGNSFEFDYFRRVRPEIDLRRSTAVNKQQLQHVEQQLQRVEQEVNGQFRALGRNQSLSFGATGHTTGFMTHGRYFGIGQR